MREQIVSLAEKLKLTDATGALKPLDSLQIIDLVVELESTLSVNIPSALLTPDHFESFDAISEMIEDLKS